VDVTDAENPVDRVLPGLGGSQADREDEFPFLHRCRHHPVVEGDAVIRRRKRNHPIVVAFKNSVAVAESKRCVHHRMFADLGDDVAHFDDLGRWLLGDARLPDAGRERCRNHGDHGE
jgi:hypothetical protein